MSQADPLPIPAPAANVDIDTIRETVREPAAVQILPGAIPFDEVELVDAGLVGRCPVCGLQVATCCHAGSGTAICSVCYEKLVREKVEIR